MIEENEYVLPSAIFVDGSEYNPNLAEATESETIESGLNSLLERMVLFNAEMPTNGTDVAISKLKQAMSLFNKQI